MSLTHHKRESTFGNVPFIDGDDFDTFHGFSSHETQIINELKLKITNQQNTINKLNELNNELKNENNILKSKINNLTRKSLEIQSSALPMRDSMKMSKHNNKSNMAPMMTMAIGNTFDLKPLHSANPSEVIDDELPNIPNNITMPLTTIQSNVSTLGVNVNNNTKRHTAQWSTAANFEFTNNELFNSKNNNTNNIDINNNNNNNNNSIGAIEEEVVTPEVNDEINNDNDNNNNNDNHYINEITMPDETPIVQRRQTDTEQNIGSININDEHSSDIENENMDVNIMNVDNYIIDDLDIVKPKDHPYMLSNDNSVKNAINQETMEELELQFEKLKKEHDNLSKSFYNLVVSKNVLVSILSNEIEKLRTIINDILCNKNVNKHKKVK